MPNRWLHTLAGLICGFIPPILLGGIIAMVASNIGIFFLIMKRDSLIFFGRGWLIATILCVMWAVLIELNAL